MCKTCGVMWALWGKHVIVLSWKACDSAELEGMQFSLYHFAHRDIIGVLTAWFCERAIVVK